MSAGPARTKAGRFFASRPAYPDRENLARMPALEHPRREPVTTKPRPPAGAKAAGRRLWSAIVDEFALDQVELVVLREMVRVVDRLDDLDAAVRDGGAVVGGRVNQALVESRQQQLVLAKLAATLKLPTDEHQGARVSDAARAIASARWKRDRRGA